MSYQVLARKWRPQSFADLVGQRHVLTALANGLTLGRVHHAYLFSGTRGVGKTSIARLLAKGLNCETGITATPCGNCANCLEIEQGRFIDLLEIDAASRTKVEDTRELLDNVQYAPARGRFKVYLIDEVHMLSRHSFNALLKTLEEPPAHVKFLLATTDPQKLPITILSRCLQFHLKALDVEQIRGQLDKVLQAEHISAEPRALQLLAKAADGSMRDALSLTDQAIAMGNGEVNSLTVSQMLGTLDDEQPLALAEALMNADGLAMMTQIEQAASRGVDWENLLVETLALLHQIAMIQLLPTALAAGVSNEQRLRELARLISPQDIQLYYQTLLVGRKEIAFAPDRRMGVEMTFLRALAFHPKALVIDEPVLSNRIVTDTTAGTTPLPTQLSTLAAVKPPIKRQNPVTAPAVAVPTEETVIQQRPAAELKSTAETPLIAELPDATAQLLQARTQLMQHQKGAAKAKKSEPAAPLKPRPASSPLERLTNVTERIQQQPRSFTPEPSRKDPYQWTAQTPDIVEEACIATPKALRTALEHEKTPELIIKLATEAALRNPWAAEIAGLTIPKLVEQLALNSFKQQISANEICLHLRSAQRHLNTASALLVLSESMSTVSGQPMTLTIIEDDSTEQQTPLEWRQVIYEEKLAQARQSIAADEHLHKLSQFFDAELDEESIRPI